MYTLSDVDVDRFKQMWRDYVSRRIPVPDRFLPNWQHVRITGPVVYDGSGSGSSSGGVPYYPGIVIKFDASRKEDVELGIIWVKDWNDMDLREGFVYSAQQTGNFEIGGQSPAMRSLFITDGNGAAGKIVRYVKCITLEISVSG